MTLASSEMLYKTRINRLPLCYVVAYALTIVWTVHNSCNHGLVFQKHATFTRFSPPSDHPPFVAMI